jgi:Putative zinc ribbon domain
MPNRQTLKNCQSCGMPLSRDDGRGGTDRDGANSETYCSHCYRRGQFVMPDITVHDMQKRVKARLVEAGTPRLLAARLIRRIPSLKRWRND